MIALAAAILGALLVLTSVELRREFASAGALRAAVQRPYDTRLQNQSVLSLMQDAETGQWGYIITGNVSFLEPYDHVLDRLDTQMTALGGLFDGNAEQTENYRNLSRQIARKRQIMQRRISLRQGGDAAAASAQVSSGEGRSRARSITTRRSGRSMSSSKPFDPMTLAGDVRANLAARR